MGRAAKFTLESADLRAVLGMSAHQPHDGGHQPGDEADQAEPSQVCGDHAEHDHQQDGAGEQLVERVDTLIEHG